MREPRVAERVRSLGADARPRTSGGGALSPTLGCGLFLILSQAIFTLPHQPTVITATPNSWRQGDLTMVSKGTPLLFISEDHRKVMFYAVAPGDTQVCIELDNQTTRCASLDDWRGQ